MSAHTPGPWTMEYVGDSKALVKAPLARTGQHEPRTYVLAKVESWTPEQTQAAGRLIAAAPAMLELLKLAQVRLFMLEGANAEYEAIDALLTELGITNRRPA